MTGSDLALNAEGSIWRIEESRVRQVQRYGDRLWNGLLIGLGTGTAMALLADPSYESCDPDPAPGCEDHQVWARVQAVALMAAVGAGVDALIRTRKPVYLRLPPSR